MKLSALIAALEGRKNSIIECGKRLHAAYDGIFMFDTYCIALLNRSINLLEGFCCLARADNFLSAFPLVRLHLDTLHRLYAFQLIEGDVDEITSQILEGKAINKFKAKASEGGRPLTDALLCDKISGLPGLEWVKDTYHVGSDFVHFSDKHIISSMEVGDDGKAFQATVSVGSPFINEDEKEGSCIRMAWLTDAIVAMIDSWSAQKATYPARKKSEDPQG
jgi:hypothetical protein